ncbi:MAG: gliding motility-associated ABC transporter substrate-binding protein GldG [Saprospiraceae bacterium]|uniref:Gliding motility-associated ABC transporter substrate-binding protein GldG n=1 Tax=Candidatus Defluviibacterium haderslevense TaxID=2981993 RepID=A0A9D7SCQ9_9BACT|nr:gliding motility-associated ABC transporter substrate-binding protein GldG [Candidatus Defluviibacterium haderslevense]MBK9719581.1 gliding motility-associated ABC transporter substrate-binding protein GldG [Candidatus Defluviibacterium haderslevense]
MEKRIPGFLQILLILGIILFINILSQYFNTYLDFTEEKRFTLTEPTKKLIKDVKNVVYIQVLLEGNFPSGFKRLQQSTKEILDQFNSENGYIEYEFENPNEGTVDVINARRKSYSEEGLIPTNLMVRSGSENKEQLIYPYAIVKLGDRKISVNLLENAPDLDQESNLSNSISLLEYKLATAIQKVHYPEKKNILFTTGHGELAREQTKSLVSLLNSSYNLAWINLDSTFIIKPEIDLLIIARPIIPFTEKNKFVLDQYVMNGGKIIWLVDGLKMSLDSLSTRNEFIPEPLDLNLTDYFFKNGIRINSNLVLDLECSRIPQVIGRTGDKPQIELFPWYYHPLIAPRSNHPIVSNIDRISLEFPSTIDTLKTKTDIKKTILLQSSQYSRYQTSPMKVGFEMMRYKPDPDKFNRPNLSIGILLEGTFGSLFENRLDEDMNNILSSIGIPFKTISSPTSMLVVADGDVIKNLYDKETGKFAPIGYNKYEKATFNGNKDFILNSIEFMINQNNILTARTKEFKLRMLDKVKAEKDKLYWQSINIVLPIILIVIFGTINFYWRKKKFIKS